MKISVDSDSDQTLEIRPASTSAINYTVTPIQQSSAVPTTETEVVDTVVTTATGASVWYDYQFAEDSIDDDLVFENLTPDVCTFSDTLLAQRIGTSGTGKIKVSLGIKYKLESISFATTAGSTHTHFVRFTEDSIADKLTSALLTLITPGSSFNYLSTINHTTFEYVKNPLCWAASIDLTGVAVSTDVQGWGRANRGALITPRHVLGAKHWNVYYPSYAAGAGYNVGSQLKYLDSNGVIHTRTAIGVATGYSDVVVITLDSDLPATVKPIKICGSWIERSRTDADNVASWYFGGTAFYVRQGQECRITMMSGDPVRKEASFLTDITVNGVDFNDSITIAPFTYKSYLATYNIGLYDDVLDYYVDASGGDSGSPVMILVDGEPALLTTWAGSKSGPALWLGNGTLINEMIKMADADGGVDTGYEVNIKGPPN